jgi:mono/diheme cytochrome c family protein
MKRILAASFAIVIAAYAAPARSADDAAIARGAYLAAAGDCEGCHTDKKAGTPAYSGGRPLVTPFGTFYGPNITPDPSGIGNYSESDFRRVMREGKDDAGRYLYPVFPFPSFTGMSDADISDLYAYFKSITPVKRESRRHDAKFPFGFRFPLIGWRMLFFTEGPLTPVAGQSEEWNRGRYLAEAVAHCEECHTPRNALGGTDRKHPFAGNPHGPDGQDAPNITSDPKAGLGDWKLEDIIEVLKSGQTPDGDYVSAGMAEVVDGTAQLTDADRHAIAIYIKSLPPLPSTPK